ncbi:MAG: hypothetical protein ACI4GO_00750, partial [Hominenteromicrobium sp.]
DNDEDIDRYIRELTGREEPKEQEKEPEEPETEQFRVTSQIGEEDYKAFIRYSTLFRFKWMLPVFIIVPLAFSLFFAFNDGRFYVGNLILSLVVMYVAITLIIVIRCARWISKIKKKSPNVMYLTETTLVFLTNSVVNMKNGNRIKVGYQHMIDVGESRTHFIMYFDNGKSMVFRKEDMPAEELNAFRPFIQSKVHKQKLTQMKKK